MSFGPYKLAVEKKMYWRLQNGIACACEIVIVVTAWDVA